MTPFQITTTADELMKKAQVVTGICDITDTRIAEPLTKLLHALNHEAELSEAGVAGMEQRVLRVLSNRLRMLRDFRDHPEIEEQQIVRPLILTGGGRTGSTKLHKMLAASGDFIYLPFWQGHTLATRSGNRNEDPSERIDETNEYINWFNTRTPTAKLIHEFHADEPEEEILLMEHANLGLYMTAFIYAPNFIDWAAQHVEEELEFVKQGLKYLQWQFYDGDTRPWVLKCPLYFGLDSLLKEVFPDAVFVATHRHPKPVLSSSTSLVHYYHKAYSDTERKEVLGKMMLDGLSQGAKNFLASREANPDLNVFDVSYSELTQSANAVVERIYAHSNMSFSEQSLANIKVWEEKNQQHKHGAHKHSLEEYGLTPAMVDECYKDYIDQFNEYF